MKKNKSKKSTLKIVAIIAAVVGGLVAIGAFLKRKADSIGETLDYDGDIYYDDDDEYTLDDFDEATADDQLLDSDDVDEDDNIDSDSDSDTDDDSNN